MTLRLHQKSQNKTCPLVEMEALSMNSQMANMKNLSISFVAWLHLSQLLRLPRQANYT